MNHISAVGGSGGAETRANSFDCGPTITDICDYYDKADGCILSDLCDYDMDGGSMCIVDACGIDQT